MEMHDWEPTVITGTVVSGRFKIADENEQTNAKELESVPIKFN
jgi:hypothetical protein